MGKRQVESSLADLTAHCHIDNVPARADAPNYFSSSSVNTFLSKVGNQVPSHTTVTPQLKHRKYADESNAGKEGARPQRTVDHEDDAVEMKRKKKYESILTTSLHEPQVKSPYPDEKKE